MEKNFDSVFAPCNSNLVDHLRVFPYQGVVPAGAKNRRAAAGCDRYETEKRQGRPPVTRYSR